MPAPLIGVIGLGVVGQCVNNSFKNCIAVDVDTKITITDLAKKSPRAVFICINIDPQEQSKAIYDILDMLSAAKYTGIVAIKSTVTATLLENLKKYYASLRILYNPEFLTQANAQHDFDNPHMQVFGGRRKDAEELARLYRRYSKVKLCPVVITDLTSAALIKYSINSWLATKVVFFNEIKELFDKSNTKEEWNTFTEALSLDPRMGSSHFQVPGADGKLGYGGKCFPKDVKSLLWQAKIHKTDLSVLKQAANKNNKLRH